MSLFELCIRRPVLSTVLSCWCSSSVRFRTRDSTCASIRGSTSRWSAFRPRIRARPHVIESQITKVLEDSLAGIEGVELMTSEPR